MPGQLSLLDTLDRLAPLSARESDTNAHRLPDRADPVPAPVTAGDGHWPLSEPPPVTPLAGASSHDTHSPTTSDRLVALDDTGPPPPARPTSRAAALVPCPRPTLIAHPADNSASHTRDTHNTPAPPSPSHSQTLPPVCAPPYTVATGHTADIGADCPHS